VLPSDQFQLLSYAAAACSQGGADGAHIVLRGHCGGWGGIGLVARQINGVGPMSALLERRHYLEAPH
jgi:hypothetical protein